MWISITTVVTGGALGAYWPLLNSEGQPSGPTSSLDLPRPQARVGRL